MSETTEILATSPVVQAIKDSATVEMVDLDGQIYLSRRTYLPPAEPKLKPLTTHTLDSIQHYIKADDSISPALMFAHVVSHEHVNLISPILGRMNQRHEYLTVDCSETNRTTFRFGAWYPPEAFVIALQTKFTDAGDRDKILKLVGTLRSEHVREASDDGISQNVTIRQGVSGLQNVDVPKVVDLAPYRTFREVEQPASKFLLRFKYKKDDLPEVALFEADGNSWQLDAVEAIAAYIKPGLKDLGVSVVF